MATILKAVLFFCMLVSLFASSSAKICTEYSFASNKQFTSCNDLPVLDAFLHWTYDPSLGYFQIAYRQTKITSSSWAAWGINLDASGMVGTQSLVAYQKSDGSMRVYTSPVTDYKTTLQEGDLKFPVSDLSAIFANNEITIFATLKIQNTSTLNLVWQNGPLASDNPGRHAISGANVRSSGSLNLLSAEPGATSGGGNSKTKQRNIHGVLNAISWGIMMPVGAIIARYVKVFEVADPAWFYLHVSCQTTAYIIGLVGWGTGLKLGGDSPGIQYSSHRYIGITLFVFGTLQVLALLVRPQKDHKYRLYWNIYHHTTGYMVILLSIINIFKGFDILNPDKKWQRGYVAIIVILSISAAILEGFTWRIVLKRKNAASVEKTPNGMTRYNVYGGRPNHRV
ncbi:cytochrome b561 and DOMON domain-containing protein At5g47530-like [Apium graveolens]|uniref:cytochrome b561 and DOMON domain-containing protein At5g47530-like n=1 Tax=Apium graveolens TaxID=4045 RepID=UPI003D7B9D9C